MEVTKTQKRRKKKFICDATGIKMVDFSMKNPDRMIGSTLQLNVNYGGLGDGLEESATFHFSKEITLDILCALVSQYTDMKLPTGIIDELSKVGKL